MHTNPADGRDSPGRATGPDLETVHALPEALRNDLVELLPTHRWTTRRSRAGVDEDAREQTELMRRWRKPCPARTHTEGLAGRGERHPHRRVPPGTAPCTAHRVPDW